MTTSTATVRNRNFELDSPLDPPDGTKLVLSLSIHPQENRDDSCADTPETISAWVQWFDSLEPVEFTPEARTKWETARERGVVASRMAG